MNHVNNSGYNFWLEMEKNEFGIAVSVSCSEDQDRFESYLTGNFDENYAQERAKEMIAAWVVDLKEQSVQPMDLSKWWGK